MSSPVNVDDPRRRVTWPAVARILIVAGGCRGRQLAASLLADGHAVRVSTRTEAGRAAIEKTGAECWVGTPDRLASMRGVTDSVAVACWLTGSVSGDEELIRELHTSRLRFFLTQLIDTTVRGFIYEAKGARTPADVLAQGEQISREITSRNVIPAAFLQADPSDTQAWLAAARAAVDAFLTTG
jgi:hypothetical protein